MQERAIHGNAGGIVEEIGNIEQRIVALALRERALIQERSRVRLGLFERAERHPLVRSAISDIFSKHYGVNGKHIAVYSQEAKSSGRGDEEFLSEIFVFIHAEMNGPVLDCGEMVLKLKITGGFEDGKARNAEKLIMDEIAGIRDEIAGLKSLKKSMKVHP
jgi:hypothetical protein